MRISRSFLAIAMVYATVSSAASATDKAEPIVFASGDGQTQLLELYTSEGCSSCPPADRWFSKLTDQPGLWKDFVPVAFHVTYWNYLGWEDRFSDMAFDNRQRQRAATAGAIVYTPGVFVDGDEYRRWQRQSTAPKQHNSQAVGRLHVTLDQDVVTATFKAPTSHTDIQVELALLASNQETNVKAGENRGRSLDHDFVVAALKQHQMTEQAGTWSASFRLPKETRFPANALAAWVVDGNGVPLQATGGWLK